MLRTKEGGGVGAHNSSKNTGIVLVKQERVTRNTDPTKNDITINEKKKNNLKFVLQCVVKIFNL